MPAAIPLPDGLNRQFESLERRLWRMDALVAATGAIGSLLLAFTLQFASDRFWDTPLWMRCLLAFCGWGGFALFALWYGSHWVWRRPSVRALAVIVQRRYRRLGDRLLGIVELADPGARPSNYSQELCAAAIDQVAGEAAAFDFKQAAANRKPRRYLLTFLGLAALVAALAIATPDAGWNALQRWLRPVSNIDRYTFVTIQALPDHLVVAQGEPFEIAVGLAHNSFWRPRNARSHFDDQPASAAPIREGVATFRFPGQTQERRLWLSVGDVTRSIRIRPMVRPDLREVRVHLVLPDYLQYPAQEQKVDAGGFNFLPGTCATFTGEAVRNLATATLHGEKPQPLAVSGPRFTTAPLLLELERNVTFTWRDTLGLEGAQPMTIHLTPREDDPPGVQLRGLAAAIAMLPEETAPIDLAATDDYGVKRVTLAWQTAATSPMDAPGPLHEIRIADGRPQMRSLGGHYDFSPALLQIQPDTTILVRGLAIDYYPNRQPASSPIYRIHVLSRESHARLIHDQFEKMLEQLEELTRRQEAIMQAGQAVRKQSPQDLANQQSAQKLGEQSNEQKQNAGQLKDLAKQIADNMAEALRNPEISPETLKDWAKHAEEMNSLASQSMPQAAKSLQSSQENSGQRQQNLDQALKQEQQILEAMRQMEKKANDNLESLMAQTLAARLKRAAGTERDIADRFQKMLPDTIGMTPGQLPADPRQALDSMSARHAEVMREAGRLQEEIARLFERTTLNRYGDVAKEMDAQKTVDNLAALGKLVDKNIGVQSIGDARYWSDQFDHWAARLGQQDSSKSGGKGSPGGSPDAAAQMQALLQLMRLRQQQDQLREQTGVLQEQKETSQEYPTGAQDAARQQGGLRDQVQALQQSGALPVPPDQLSPVAKSMGDAAGLLAKPETGQPTNAAQTDAINLLDSAIAQASQKMGSSANALAAMMGMGGMGKGNTSGGTTDKPNIEIPGSREGPGSDQRRVMQAGGMDNTQLPGEFRDAIESYQRAMEQSSQP
ncbi:MAG TPA: hypothetical protein VHY22_05980 [Chthoniobacteraceae bacterium]|jgi:hypothetical protein|nr:hypothetical protein [Chthoniobacteraceae bacterium]